MVSPSTFYGGAGSTGGSASLARYRADRQDLQSIQPPPRRHTRRRLHGGSLCCTSGPEQEGREDGAGRVSLQAHVSMTSNHHTFHTCPHSAYGETWTQFRNFSWICNRRARQDSSVESTRLRLRRLEQEEPITSRRVQRPGRIQWLAAVIEGPGGFFSPSCPPENRLQAALPAPIRLKCMSLFLSREGAALPPPSGSRWTYFAPAPVGQQLWTDGCQARTR